MNELNKYLSIYLEHIEALELQQDVETETVDAVVPSEKVASTTETREIGGFTILGEAKHRLWLPVVTHVILCF